MIIGAGHNQVAYIERAKALGLFTVALDGNPHAPGFAVAHAGEVANIRDAEAVTGAAQKFRVDAIYPSAEVGVEATAAAASRLSLPGVSLETARKVRHKGAMRQAVESAGIAANPPFKVVSDLSEALDWAVNVGFPVVVKPADGQGSRSVVRVDTKDQLRPAFTNALDASYRREVVIEQFMEGESVSVEALVFNEEVLPVAITGRIMSRLPHRFNLGIYMPANLSADESAAAKKFTAQCLQAVGFTSGSTHTEVMLTKDGFKLVEMAGRLGGARIPTGLVPLAYGVDLGTESIKVCLGERPDVRHRYARGAALLWLIPPAGRLMRMPDLDEAKAIPGVEEVVWNINKGEDVPRAIDCISRDRIGYVIASGPTVIKAIAIAKVAGRMIEERLQIAIS